MAKTNASAGFDAGFDPSALFGAFKMPAFDIEALTAVQQRNLEAVTAANKLVADGFKTLTTRQGELMSGAVDVYVSAMRDLMGVQDPKASAAKQAELAKATVENTVANSRELGEIATKANAEVFDVLQKRVVEGLEEFKTFAAQA